MANYIASTFIGTYASSSKTIRIKNAVGQVVFTINVCNYQKSFVSGKNLNIVLEDNNKEYKLDFSTNGEAKQALNLFKTAVDTLKPNCAVAAVQGGEATAAVAPIAITYAAYKAAAAGATLIALQWYDVTDTGGAVVSAGSTMRLLPLATNDSHPRGILTGNLANIAIDTINDQVLFYELASKKITLINSNPNASMFDGLSSNIVVKSGGNINTTNSTYISVEENSSLTISNSIIVRALNGSNVTVANATNVTFENIVQNLSTLGFALSNVTINRNTSLGKLGRTVLSTPVTATLQAYDANMEQDIIMNGTGDAYVFTIENKFIQAGAEFRFRYRGTGNTNTVTIKNKDNSLLYEITDTQKDTWVILKYNKNTGFFEFSKLDGSDGSGSGTPYKVATVTNGQTAFPLPTPANTADRLQMFINGQKKVFGLDYTYSGGTVTYLNRVFTLSSTDEVEFIIY